MAEVAAQSSWPDVQAVVTRLQLPELRISQLRSRPARAVSEGSCRKGEDVYVFVSFQLAAADVRLAQLMENTADMGGSSPPLAPALIPVPSLVPEAVEPPVVVLCSGPLLKTIKLSLLRRLTEVRYVQLSMKMLPTGSVYQLRESTSDSFFENIITAVTLAGKLVTFTLENGESVTFQLDRHSESEWMRHIRGIKDSSFRRRVGSVRMSK